MNQHTYSTQMPNAKHATSRPHLLVRTDTQTTRDASELCTNSASNTVDPYEFYREKYHKAMEEL